MGDVDQITYDPNSFTPDLQVQDISRPIAAVIAVVVTTSLSDLAGPAVQPGRANSRGFANNNLQDCTFTKTSLETEPRCSQQLVTCTVGGYRCTSTDYGGYRCTSTDYGSHHHHPNLHVYGSKVVAYICVLSLINKHDHTKYRKVIHQRQQQQKATHWLVHCRCVGLLIPVRHASLSRFSSKFVPLYLLCQHVGFACDMTNSTVPGCPAVTAPTCTPPGLEASCTQSSHNPLTTCSVFAYRET